MINREEALAVALDAARASSEILVQKHSEYFGTHKKKLAVSTKESAIDYLTEVDGLAQEAIINIIQKRFPEHRFIAEEEGAESLGDPDSPYQWVIDPLDGTLCFIHGKPNFGTIVSLQENNETIVGVMMIPLLHLTFHAVKGAGAFANDEPVKLRETKEMTDAILCSNMIRRAVKDEQGVLQIPTPYCASIENYGSAVDEIGQVLLGWNDGCFFKGIPLWDIAAGCLLIEEAGGKAFYDRIDPNDPRSRTNSCVMTTAPIFDEVLEFVTEKI